jgi:hypothetical protein
VQAVLGVDLQPPPAALALLVLVHTGRAVPVGGGEVSALALAQEVGGIMDMHRHHRYEGSQS